MYPNGKIIKCKFCGKERYRNLYRLQRNRHNFCSTGCRKKGKIIKCEICGKKSYRRLYRLQKNKHNFCSSICHGKWIDKTHPFTKIKKKETIKRYCQKNREKRLKYRREYSKKNREKERKRNREYSRTPAGKLTKFKSASKRRNKFPFKLTPLQLQMIKHRDKTCVYCGSNKHLGFDHVNPNGSTILNNLVLCCTKCNSSKGNKDVFDWCRQKNRPVPAIVKQLSQDKIIFLNRFIPNRKEIYISYPKV